LDFSLSGELLVLLFSVGLTAGIVDAMAGGGGLIAMPALLSVGLSPVQALATNKLQGAGGTLSASIYFIRRKAVDLGALKWLIIMTFLGSVAGTTLVQLINPGILKQLIPFLLVGIVLYFIFAPDMSDGGRQRVSLSAFAFTAALGIGFYDGFFGPGTGALFVVAFTSLLGYSMTRATAHTKVLNCTSNMASLLFFAIAGHVVWEAGLVMLMGQIFGARLGAKLVLGKGKKYIRPMIIVISLSMTAKLLWENYGTYASG